MSYDISYKTDKKLSEFFKEGGIINVDGTNSCFLNVTYNYSEMFDFRSLHEKKGKDVYFKLKEFVDTWKDATPYEIDYWASTPGNVVKAVKRLMSFIELDPEAEFEVC